MVVHPDSKLGAEHQVVHLSKLQGGLRRALDRVQIVVSSGIAFTVLDLITRPSPFRATMCSSVWNRLPSHVPKCHLSVMTHPEPSQQLRTSPLSQMARAPIDVDVSSIAHTQICHHSPHGNCSGCPLRARQSTETPASGQRSLIFDFHELSPHVFRIRSFSGRDTRSSLHSFLLFQDINPRSELLVLCFQTPSFSVFFSTRR